MRFFKSNRAAGSVATLAVAALAILPASAQAGSGGMGPGSTDPAPTVPGGKAKLVSGIAYAPASAPQAVKDIIAAANKIRNKPYIYGGGHGSFNDNGYDCSGSVSYALRGGRFVAYPLASTGFMNWRSSGKGRWISVYANSGHAYMIVAGLRFDTSMTPGNGPGWSKSLRSTPGSFTVRHPAGF